MVITVNFGPISHLPPTPEQTKDLLRGKASIGEALGLVLLSLKSEAKFTFTSLTGTENISHQINPNK